jgi:dephospho-CoA kinase
MTRNNCLLIGLTGGIATGKSTVSGLLLEKGYKIIDADIISREVVKVGKSAYNDIVNTFGLRILMDDRSINRKKLGRLIFNSSILQDALNNIVHPRVFEEIKLQINKYCHGNRIIFLDIPLLFEAYNRTEEYGIVFDEIWLVYTDKENQLKRLMQRDKIGKEEALSKINSQLSLEDKIDKSTRVLINNGDIHLLEENLNKLLEEIEK